MHPQFGSAVSITRMVSSQLVSNTYVSEKVICSIFTSFTTPMSAIQFSGSRRLNLEREWFHAEDGHVWVVSVAAPDLILPPLDPSIPTSEPPVGGAFYTASLRNRFESVTINNVYRNESPA